MTAPASILTLPAELRVRIYEYLYSDRVEPVLILRNDYQLQQPWSRWFPHPGTGLVRTCRTIYHEVLPILYAQAYFRVQLHLASSEWPAYQSVGPISGDNRLLREIQHLDITMHFIYAKHVEPAMASLGLFARALEAAEARLETLRVVMKATLNISGEVTVDLVQQTRDAARKEEEEKEERCQLYCKMLREADLVTVR